LFETSGYEPITTRNGKEGLQKAKELLPDLIILDVMMPEAGGVTMYRELKADQELKSIPVIMLTGVGKKSFSHYLKMLNIKVKDPIPQPNAYMEKPLDHEKLLELTKSIIG
jgi:CheY-like chemotaxis protein